MQRLHNSGKQWHKPDIWVNAPPAQHRKGKKEELEEQAGTVKAKAKRFGHWFGHKANEAKDVTADNLSKASVRGPAQP
jgi:hypothetical protein